MNDVLKTVLGSVQAQLITIILPLVFAAAKAQLRSEAFAKLIHDGLPFGLQSTATVDEIHDVVVKGEAFIKAIRALFTKPELVAALSDDTTTVV